MEQNVGGQLELKMEKGVRIVVNLAFTWLEALYYIPACLIMRPVN
jgi:hypothetical protein